MQLFWLSYPTFSAPARFVGHIDTTKAAHRHPPNFKLLTMRSSHWTESFRASLHMQRAPFDHPNPQFCQFLDFCAEMESVALHVLGDWNESVECTGVAAPSCFLMQFSNCWYAYDRHIFVFDELDRFEFWTTDSGSLLDNWNYWSPFVKVYWFAVCLGSPKVSCATDQCVGCRGGYRENTDTYDWKMVSAVTSSVRCDRLCPLIGSASGTNRSLSAFSFVQTLINARVK